VFVCACFILLFFLYSRLYFYYMDLVSELNLMMMMMI